MTHAIPNRPRAVVSFQDWCTWARSNGRRWARVAENAEAEARYKTSRAKSDFQAAIGAERPKETKAYDRVCWEHPLRGGPVDGTVPSYLTRCVSYDALRGYARDLLRAVGSDISRRGHATEQADVPPSPSRGWMHAGQFLDLAEDLWEAALCLAYKARGGPAAKSVFATPQPDDDAPPSDDHTPAFYATIQSAARADQSEADCAVYRLALGQKAEESEDYVLLYYPWTRDASACKYPVPPDAAFQPLFRPVDENAPFGQTSPGPIDEDHADHAEPELVHPNHPLAPREVWMCTLDASLPTDSRT